MDCRKGPASDKEGFASFVRELSEAFRPKGLLLSAAVSPSKRVIDEGYDVPTLAKYMDWISVMTYDYHGQWDKKTGHVAPLYQLPNDWEPSFNAVRVSNLRLILHTTTIVLYVTRATPLFLFFLQNFSIHYWMEKGAPPEKLIMGAPLYGQSFSLADRSHRGLNVPTYGGGEAGEATRARGFLSYYEVTSLHRACSSTISVHSRNEHIRIFSDLREDPDERLDRGPGQEQAHRPVRVQG